MTEKDSIIKYQLKETFVIGNETNFLHSGKKCDNRN